ncbi:3-deoxy-manno-octulosonate cytidylyltransferase [Sphingomonas sp. H39-1-10]|uniref:3-deoxy-manno-octulosonate cytidylyltransferase n=1 Tax=Sphingomonas TaxID=13687 RepID=UPI00089121B4|nr:MULTISPECIES: manno-octulosonate cytidylyltransferase [Sphingomonas]MDF0486703.1 3-deoxy-manno-octulosonate cytidylyltransferase [Sphingomonas pollutisoli]SDA35487.1 3-deoxy-manno-octulosonate cytidylyltransferase (CMP-KDO synthetase) [Sphingomonas sp. NFR15]
MPDTRGAGDAPPDLIVIPARYGSTRLPGKPLVSIAGRTLLSRVVAIAREGARRVGNAEVVVATDDPRILDHARELGCAAVMTDPAITSGSGRAWAVARERLVPPPIVVNLQGDAPFAAPDMIAALITALRASPCGVATPVVRLDWRALDALRAHKLASPFSGTTCARRADDRALWFSKAVIPAIRNEGRLRGASDLSPIFRHIGLYAYRFAALRRFEETEPTPYEVLEGLEQLRFLETGEDILTVAVAPPRHAMSGIDTPEDVAMAEALIAEHGEPHLSWA